MDRFPLAPFLAALATDGIRVTLQDYGRISLALQAAGPWTVARLRGVCMALLVQDPEQEEVFVKRFDAFFSPHLAGEERFAEVDVARALADLQGLGAPQPQGAAARALPRTTRLVQAASKVPPSWRFLHVALLGVLWLSLVLGGDAFQLALEPGTMPGPVKPSTQTPPQEPILPKTLTEVLSRVSTTPEIDWQTPTRFAALTFLVTLLYGVYLWRSRRLPEDKEPPWNRDAPRAFRLGSGAPGPWLDAATLDRLADALGYFQSAQPSTVLDVPASINATTSKGGIPSLVFHRRPQLRRVLILEDILAQALAWNPVARELAHGLRQRGVPVIFGTFQGLPQQFRTDDGAVMQLDDLEDDRRGYVVLLCSDGKGLHPQRAALALEALARWPMVAWMELREPRSWDESTALVAGYRIPVYPATAEGLLQAMGRFVTERGATVGEAAGQAAWHGLPPYGGVDLAGYTEVLLGDALPWAQACAMLQPIPTGLADALRRRFCPHVPIHRLERLVALPGTQHSAAGWRFSLPVLAVLRQGFQVRWEAGQQEDILRFVVEQLGQLEPAQPDSLAHLTWEWLTQRVRLEYAPEAALERLAQLAKTPLGHAIRAELEPCVVPEVGARDGGSTGVPLRVRPRGKDALQRLGRLAEHSGIPLLEAYPIARGHWLVVGLLLVLVLGLTGVGVERYRRVPVGPDATMEFVLISAGTFQMGANDGEKDEQPVHQVTISRPFYLGRHEVTQEQWQAVMGKNPSYFSGDQKRPVEQVSWDDVQGFIRELNRQEGGSRYRLPTEAEWEYAARAGTVTAYSFGDDVKQLSAYAWYAENAEGKTHPVGQLRPNPWGLYDMHGNVREWVQDWYAADYYKQSAGTPAVDPSGPAAGSYRVFRGGSWRGAAGDCRSAYRNNAAPGHRNRYLGFRVLRTAP